MKSQAKQLLEEIDDIENEEQPDDDDMFVSDVRDGVSVSVEGKNIGTFADYDEADKAIKEWMDKHNFHPSIWWVSDHGNVSPYTMG